MDKQRALYLIQQYRDQSITEEELNELRQWMQEHADSPLFKEAIEEDLLQNTHAEIISAERLDIMFQNVMKADKVKLQAAVRKIRIRWVAAACILLVTGYVLWVTVGRRSQVTGSKEEIAKTHDVPAPTNTRAVITLADGRKVYLDSVSNGTIAQENNVNVVKNDKGEILYLSPAGSGGLNDSPNNKRPGVDYNTLYNPRGSKVISLTLSDGTKVWLNSESSLRYPIAFNGDKREVEITGEAYFEVKHNTKQPFKVHLPNGSIVEDIGTSFNINAYTDENNIKTTLIEGSVKVVGDAALNTNNGVVLKPGQQAVLNTFNLQLLTFNNVDLEETLAWKDGLFKFNNTDIETMMRQAERWYDVTISYPNGIPTDKFGGTLSRDVNLSQFIKILEYSDIKVRIEGKTITIMK